MKCELLLNRWRRARSRVLIVGLVVGSRVKWDAKNVVKTIYKSLYLIPLLAPVSPGIF